MGLASRDAIAAQLMAHGWPAALPAAIVCGASTAAQWTWTGRLDGVGHAAPPADLPGVLVVGDVIQVRDALSAVVFRPEAATDEVMYGRNG
jgi:siroheme synthase